MSAELSRFLGFAFANADVLIEVRAGGTISFATGAVQHLLGVREAALIGQPIEMAIAPGDRGLVQRLLRTLGPNCRLTPRTVTLSVQNRAAVLSGYRLGSSQSVQLTLTKVNSLATSSPTADRDQQTGLVQSDAFQNQLAERFGLDGEVGAPKLSLVKIADFGEVRSRLSQEAMARLLAEIGALLRVHAADDSLAARLGEDRFGLVHSDAVDVGAIRSEIQATGRAIDPGAPPLTVQNSTIDLASPGLSREDAGRVLLFTVRRFAEEEHTSEISTMTDALQVLVDQTVNRVAKLRSTITGQRLSLQYQPIVSIADRSLHHFEALARFPDAAAGPTIAFAESVGLVQDVDLMVAQKAIDELLAPSATEELKIAVNMSAASLGSDIFVAAYRKLINRFAFVAPRLLIEVTESSTITDLERAARILNDFRNGGQVICLDDFGAGAASFPYLQALPVDFVKIDGSYIKRLGQSRRDDAILRGMVGLSRDIGVKTIAEMVETVEQANQIMAFGIDFGQGYLFGRPENTPSYTPAGPIGVGKRKGARETWG